MASASQKQHEYHENLPKAQLDENGHEILDDTPVASTLRIKPQSEYQRIRSIIINEMSQAAEKGQLETWMEANDFDVGDDFDPTTPYEEQFDPETGQSNWENNPQFHEEKPKKKSSDKARSEAVDEDSQGSGDEGPGNDENA